MARYIDLDKLLASIDARNGRLPLWLAEIISDECEAADVAPVKRGEWQDYHGIFRCSECGYSFEHEGYKHFFHFCPSCGVRMDGEKNET